MLYLVPDLWTQQAFELLPDEDDRYEYKSGRLIDHLIDGSLSMDKLEEDLSKEIGALVNSFGGTLFIGAKDKTKELDGCPIFIKGNEYTKEWLEKKIPTWFEFRLYSFRVNYVQLDDETAKSITASRCLIHVDVWDGGFLPHQVKKSGLYYYRESSSSVRAPLHYLSFLWGSRTQGMSEKVRRWCLEFLNPAIEFLRQSRHFVSGRLYKITIKVIPPEQPISQIVLFDFMKWLDYLSDSHLAAKQFFFEHPQIKADCSNMYAVGIELERAFSRLSNQIVGSGLIVDHARRLYARQMEQYPNAEIPEDAGRLLRNLAGVFGSTLDKLTDADAEKEIQGLVANMVGWRLAGIEPVFHPTEASFWSFSDTIAKEVQDNPEIVELISDLDQQFESTKSTLEQLIEKLDRLRDELASTNTATYF